MKIGDRVIVNGEYAGLEFKDEAGRIIGFANGDVCIEFDRYVKGCSYCNIVVGMDTKPGHCWFVSPDMIKKEETMKERIEALEKELAELKACQKYEPKKGNYIVQGDGTIFDTEEWEGDKDYKGVGRAFDTTEKAEKARDIMVKHDIILKYVIDHAPEFDMDLEEEAWSVWYDLEDKEWVAVLQDIGPDIGIILMPEWVAEKLADDLNNNRIEGV